MVAVSVCVITFNEEHNLPACLESIQSIADEVIVVDSHSQDRTREIAEDLGAQVVQRDWPGHIDQKNFAIDQARNQWVLCLDADERVSPELKAEIEECLADDGPAASGDVVGFSMPRRTFYLGRFIDHAGWYPDRKLRLFRRDSGRWGGVNPHDRVELQGAERALRGDLHHYSYRDIGDHLKTIDFFSSISAREKVARGQGLLHLRMLLSPPLKFLKMYVLKRGFLDGWPGFVVSALGSYYELLKYARAWELQRLEGTQAGTGEAVSYGRRGEGEGAVTGEPVSGEADSELDQAG